MTEAVSFRRLPIRLVLATSGTTMGAAALVLAAALAAGCGSSGASSGPTTSSESSTASSPSPPSPSSTDSTVTETSASRSRTAPPAPPPPPPVAGSLTVASALTLNATVFTPGSTMTGAVTYKNAGTVAVNVDAISITSIPPGGTQAAGPYQGLSPGDGAFTVQPGSSVTLTASRTFATTDPVGTWQVYSSYQDSTGAWHSGTTAYVNVQAAPAAAPLWVTGYYPAWATSVMTPAQIDYTAVTHVCHFSVVPNTDGTLDSTVNGTIDQATAAAVITPAHAAGRKVLITVGGGGSGPNYEAAISPSVCPTFVNNIVQFVTENGYDGADLDMEPLTTADGPNYMAFVTRLRSALRAASPDLLLTAAVDPGTYGILTQLQAQLDQINIMTYDMSGLWSGWVTWYNAPLMNSASVTLPSGGLLPSIDSSVKAYTGAGVANAKIGIGLAFYGYLWSGATGPDQSLTGVTMTAVTYATIMENYYQSSTHVWDPNAQASYLTSTASGGMFISYDDVKDCTAKVNYARSQALGGVIIWNLTDGWLATQPSGQQDPLLQAVKAAAFGAPQ
jgi:chitinase